MFDDLDPVGFPGQLNFVHKRLFGAAKSFVTSGFNPLAAVGGFLAPTAPPIRITRQPCPPGTRQTLTGCGPLETIEQHIGRADPGGFAARSHAVHGHQTRLGVPAPFSLSGGGGGGGGGGVGARLPAGDAVMGRYGAGLTPVQETRVMNRCLPGMVLGDDDVCYNRGQVPNKRRMWPKGRKPLLTGGEMNAITIAARAARRVKATTKKLQALGMLDRPRPRSRAATRPAARLALPPATSIINVD